MYPTVFKRLLDVVAAGLLLVVLAPLLACIAAAIRLEDGGPALYRQRRLGRGGREFLLLKFRSMPVNTESLPSSMAGSLRVTRVGRVIRRTNLDELPQLVNILKGEMSLVGPRPALPSQRDLIAMREDAGATRCRPGLTGLAQVSAYTGMPVTEKAELDGRYATRISLAGDLAILFRTIGYLRRPPPVY